MNLTRQPEIPSGVGPGWEKIVAECDQALAAIDPDYRIAQVKEKFGGLRFYYDSELPWESDERTAMEVVVNHAEIEASATCEVCGDPGWVHPGYYWLKTLCDTCDATRPLSSKLPV